MFLNFSFQIFLLFFLTYLLASRLTLIRLSTLIWLRSCNHCILTCFLWSKKPKHSSSNHGLCYSNSCNPRLSLADALIFSLMFSQALFMSSQSLKFSKAANLFVIWTWYCFLTSISFSFLRLNLSQSNFRAVCLLTANLSLILKPPDSDQCPSKFPCNFVHLLYSTTISYLSICDQSGCECSHQERSSCTYESFIAATLRSLNNWIFWCGIVYNSNTIIITILM